jgi:hypothetical protein
MVGRGDVHGVDVAAAEELAEIMIDGAVAVTVVFVDASLGALARALFDVTDSHVLNVAAAEEGPQIAAAHIADADAAHHDPLAGRRSFLVAQGGAGDDVRGRHGRGGGFQKPPSSRHQATAPRWYAVSMPHVQFLSPDRVGYTQG